MSPKNEEPTPQLPTSDDDEVGTPEQDKALKDWIDAEAAENVARKNFRDNGENKDPNDPIYIFYKKCIDSSKKPSI